MCIRDCRGRCALHTANLSRCIHNVARAIGSFLGYYECVKTYRTAERREYRVAAFRHRSPPSPSRRAARPATRYLTRGVFLEVAGFVEPAEGGNAEVPPVAETLSLRDIFERVAHAMRLLKVVFLPRTRFTRYSIIDIVIRSTRQENVISRNRSL